MSSTQISTKRAFAVFFLAFVLFGLLPQASYGIVVKVTNECRTNPSLKNDTEFAEFFNKCRRDTSDVGILRYISEQVVLWANADAYLLYITILLAFMPTIAWWNNPDPDLSIKAYRIRFNLLLLLFRIALAYNMSIWLIAAFDLEKPCLCYATDTDDERSEVIVGEIEGTGPWGMPSLECVTGTLIAIYFFEHVTPFLGLLMLFFVPMAQLCLGYNSLGQVIAGIFTGMMIHIYQIRSALFLRPLDTLFSFILGYTLLSVAKDQYPAKSFDWARVFLSTFVWQVCM
eukprot:TRINITY_DN3347_c0_g1_i2.p1 TRINITY_DN3347_c0_g1~~TRINITY_DN3347_c0_g1_i2.p1  ORF type:complete len:286 (+),score=50.39 TRINITY_DN3347_c0_g1_i2:58-915(+)